MSKICQGRMDGESDDNSASKGGGIKRKENKKQQLSRDIMLGCELWTDGLICAFEFVRGHRKFDPRSATQNSVETQKQSISKYVKSNNLTHFSNKNDSQKLVPDADTRDGENQENNSGHFHMQGRSAGNYWIPIGWRRISELLQTIQVDAGWVSDQPIEFSDEEADITVAEVAAPYWECSVGPTWWCHVAAGHPSITTWLSNAQWLHPAISTALRDESKLISDRMKHLLYEVFFLFLFLSDYTEISRHLNYVTQYGWLPHFCF